MLSSCLASRPPAWQGVRVTTASSPRRIGAAGLQDPGPAARRGRAAAARGGLRRGHLAAGRGARPASSRSSSTTTSARWTTSSSRSSGAGPTRTSRASNGRWRPTPSLRTLWQLNADPRGAAFTIEFVALANHRKAIRAEIARLRRAVPCRAARGADRGARRPRASRPSSHAADRGAAADDGSRRCIGSSGALGVTAGHDATVAFIEQAVAGARKPPT